MTVTQEAIQAGLTLADVAARNTATLVADRVRSAKTSRDMSEQINQLTEIINDLLADKALLITLGQQMDEQLVAQKISEDELTFITDTLIPALESLLSSEEVGAESSGAGPLASLDVIKTLLTPEMLTMLQLVGFNFKEAIGTPLTELLAALIRQQVPGTTVSADELSALVLQREILTLQVATDSGAANRAKGLLEQVHGTHPRTTKGRR